MPANPGQPELPDRADTTRRGDGAERDASGPPHAAFVAAISALYVVGQEIGRGGAASVYSATDSKGTLVALKVLRPEMSISMTEARLRREIQIASDLSHPHVLSVLEFGSAAGQFYFTMPFIPGGTLRARLARERFLSIDDSLGIARQVAAGLDYAHARGVIHRDVKPANILLADHGAVVADFGLARVMVSEQSDRITDSGVVVGTAEYMSPEQTEAQRDLDSRSDIYALGCVVYEMLAGEPPFTGPTAQSVIARHCAEAPRSIRTVRPAVPFGVQCAIERALAKVPADRFATAGAFVEALHDGLRIVNEPAPRRGATRTRRALAAGAVLSAIGIGVLTLNAMRPASLDSNRVVVFPLNDLQRAGADSAAGDEVAVMVGAALNKTLPLRWIDGWELLPESQRSSGARLEPRAARRLARRAGAGYFVEGSILRSRDSVTVVLRLYDVIADSVLGLETAVAAADGAFAPHLGLDAISRLLPALIATGGRVDLGALRERSPAAIANFLQGEREYRRMQFGVARTHYETALAADSALALAALKGAQAATWLSEHASALQLSAVALERVRTLSPAEANLARAVNAYVLGAADSAARSVRRTLRADSTNSSALALFAEIQSRMLPNEPKADSLARAALAQARRVDPDFAPALLMLEEFALRDGDLREAEDLRRALSRAGADTTHATSRDLMLACVRGGPSGIDWGTAAHADAKAVLSAAHILGMGAAQPPCAIAAFRAYLDSPTVPDSAKWTPLLAVVAQLVATEQRDLLDTLMPSPVVTRHGSRARLMKLLLADARVGFDNEASAIADTVAQVPRMPSAASIWHLGIWEAHRGNVERVRVLYEALAKKADSAGGRVEQLLSASLRARLLLLERDSAGAIGILRKLTPSGGRQQITWTPAESLGSERMLLAELLFRRGDLRGALDVASLLDETGSLANPLYLRQSLSLRADIAAGLGDNGLARSYRYRLDRLKVQ